MIVVYIAYALLFVGFLLLFRVQLSANKNKIHLETKRVKNPKIAILIPARDESKVIEPLLKSILDQSISIPPEHVYIIVEKETDPTIAIAKKYHMQYFIRQKLDLKTKGYALQELIEDLEKKKEYYDLYFILDADNILDKDFIRYMLDDYQAGYAISTGYRALKNRNHYFPISAGLTFYFINEIRNRNASKKNGSMLLSGTGYYIHGEYIKKWQTFPFHSLTEDYESSLYYALNNISTHYQPQAIFYDEQPENYRKSIVQRSRWIKGYFKNYLAYQKLFKEKLRKHPENKGAIIGMRIGVLPALCIVLGLLLLLGVNITNAHSFFVLIAFIYLVLVIVTAYILALVSKSLQLNKKLYLQVLFYHPIFLISYVHAFLRAIIKHNLNWEVIKHETTEYEEISKENL